MERTRVAIVGLGLIGKAHLDALRRLPEVEIVALCGHGEDSLRQLAARQGIARFYTDVKTMIAETQLDAVHNCTPNASHDGVNRAAIEAGLHIYAEKPLADSAQAAWDIWRFAKAKGVVHGLNHQYRLYPAVQEMKTRIQRGDMGRVFLAGGCYHQQSGLYQSDYNWRMTEGGLSYALSDIGTHWVDTVRCVSGQEIRRVFAHVQTIHAERTRPDGECVPVQTDDLSCVLMEFESGMQGVLTVSKVSAGHMNDLRVHLDGQHCSLAWAQEMPGRLRIGFKGRPNEDLQIAPQLMSPQNAPLVTLPGGHPLGFGDALLASVHSFYQAVRGEIAPSAMRCATFADGAAGMAFVDAALESHRTRQWAEIWRPVG